MKHVFVETNWVVDVVAPAHHQNAAAARLLDDAAAGRLLLHLPSICLTESRLVIPNRFKARTEAKAVRHFVERSRGGGRLADGEAEVVLRVVDQMVAAIQRDLDDLDRRLEDLAGRPGMEVFPLTEAMLTESRRLALRDPPLKPFDQAILAAVLVRAADLRAGGVDRCTFCEIDSDLLPWDKNGDWRPSLRRLYDQARVWVCEGWDPSEEPWAGWPDADPPESA